MEYSDVIYGTFSIPPDIAAIIATPVFQRLKCIKQVGLLCKIIPAAIHTRFEHCVGTYFRARLMLERIEQNTYWITRIPKLYKMAVEVAALLHDIGHGPFSHCWEHIADDYHHEKNALPCIDVIFKTLSGFDVLRENNNFGIELIKALILGDSKLLSQPVETKYSFIFEIVSNKKCELDVDKWDYLKRDHHYLRGYLSDIGCCPNMDFDAIFLEARANADGIHIEYRFEDYKKIYALFETRFKFHLNCYRIPINRVLDQIIGELLRNRLRGQIDGNKLTEIKANNMSAYLQLTDDRVIDMVLADEENKWMLDIKNIEQINCELHMQDVPNYLKVTDILKAAGSEMPSDDKFNFYGNEREMQFIDCSRGIHIRESHFRFRSNRALNGCQSNL